MGVGGATQENFLHRSHTSSPRQFPQRGYGALQEHFVGCCAASGAPLGFFVISDKEPKRRLEPRVLKIPHASGVQRITVNLYRAKCRTASFRWWKIALTSV